MVTTCEQIYSAPIRRSYVIHPRGDLGLISIKRRIDPEIRTASIRLTYAGLETVEILFQRAYAAYSAVSGGCDL